MTCARLGGEPLVWEEKKDEEEEVEVGEEEKNSQDTLHVYRLEEFIKKKLTLHCTVLQIWEKCNNNRRFPVFSSFRSWKFVNCEAKYFQLASQCFPNAPGNIVEISPPTCKLTYTMMTKEMEKISNMTHVHIHGDRNDMTSRLIHITYRRIWFLTHSKNVCTCLWVSGCL